MFDIVISDEQRELLERMIRFAINNDCPLTTDELPDAVALAGMLRDAETNTINDFTA